MKTLTSLLLTVFVLGVRGYLIKVPTAPVIQPSVAPVGWVQLQKLLLPLFENVCELSADPVIVKLSQEFKEDMTNGNYQKPEVITNVQNLKGLLPKGKIFTEYNIDHLNELKIIYELFYYANDFNTFYKVACWARQNVNCGLFVDALYSAIIHRGDMEKISIPAPYEILPNYFIRKDFITRASSIIAGDDVAPCDCIRNDGNAYILDVNYTSNVYDNTDESKLVYFYEDIGLNSYYYLSKLKMLPWINTKPKGRYGEYLYYQTKQLMARYNLERYSNGLQEIEGINWDYFNTVPYDPMLVYSDGSDFSQITPTQIESNEKLAFLKNIENNIATIVTHMRDGGFNKSEILNHLMEILITSEKSYENVALQILNEGTLINNRPPTVLGHYMTTLRDPAFWALNKKIVDIVDNALKMLPGYTRNELYFPGVEILNVDVKKMMTSMDNFVFDVTDALETSEKDIKFKVKISQSRLNHKPFSIKVNITSLVTQKGLIKIYLGPKVKPGEHAFKKNLFMLLDSSEINLKFGNNIITRTSLDMIDNSDDLASLYAIRKKLADAEFGLDTLKLKSIYEQIRFPSRLVVPKGLAEGLALQIFVFVVPFGKTVGNNMINPEINRNTLISPGFPLDLDIEVGQLFDLPNALVKDIVVIHKDDEQSTNYGGKSGPRYWQNNDYDTPSERVVLPLGSRPAFTMRKEPYDYKSKKGQYGKQEDYAAKRSNYKYNNDNKDQVKEESFKINDDKYIIDPEVTTEKIIRYIPIDTIIVNEDKFGFLVSTDMFDKEKTFLLDKKIEVKQNNDYMSNEEIKKEKSSDDSDEVSHTHNNNDKNIIDDEKIDDKIIQDKVAENFDKIINKSQISNTFWPYKMAQSGTKSKEVHTDVTKSAKTKPGNNFADSDTQLLINVDGNENDGETIGDKKVSDKIVTKYFGKNQTYDTFIIDKQIQDKSNNEEHIHIDAKIDEDNNQIERDISLEDADENFNKQIHNKWVIDVIMDKKIVPQKTLQGDDEVIYKQINKKDIIDISKTIKPVNWPYMIEKPFPTVYDIVLNPFVNINGSDEKIYE